MQIGIICEVRNGCGEQERSIAQAETWEWMPHSAIMAYDAMMLISYQHVYGVTIENTIVM